MVRRVLQTVRVAGGRDSLPLWARTYTYTDATMSNYHQLSKRASTTSSHLLTDVKRRYLVSPSLAAVNLRNYSAQSHPTPVRDTTASISCERPKEETSATTERELLSRNREKVTMLPNQAPHVSSMAKLRLFLSTQEVARHYTIRDIRHRYTSWKSDGVIHSFTSDDFSLLLRFLGTLSTSQFQKPLSSLYTHPRASEMPQSAYTPHWDLITHILHDKRWLLYSLTPSDRYWAMRLNLARFWEHLENNPLHAERALMKASEIYRIIRKNSAHPDMHVPYLLSLMAASSEESVGKLADSLSWILRRRGPYSPSIVDTIMRAILQHWHRFPPSSAQAMFSVIAHRIHNNDCHNQADDDQEPFVQPSAADNLTSTSIDGLVVGLASAVFGSTSINANGDVGSWALVVANRVFTLDSDCTDTINIRWNCLILLALARTRSSEGSSQDAEKSRNPIQHAAVVEWQTVCTLAALESLLRSFRSPSFAEAVRQALSGLLRKLWREWSMVEPSYSPPRPLVVSRIMCTSFLKVAGQLKDGALVHACREFCVAAGLWSVHDQVPSTEAGLRELAEEQLYASLVCGTFFERALVDLMAHTHPLWILRTAVDTAITRFMHVDPEHAQELIAWSSARALVPSSRVIAGVGVALARRGIGNFFDRYTGDARLTPELRAKVIVAHLSKYVQYGRKFMNPRAVADALQSVFLLIPQMENPDLLLIRLRSSLIALIRHQYAHIVVAMIIASQPSLFQAAFYTHLLRALLYHGQSKVAVRLLLHCMPIHPDMAQRWMTLVVTRFRHVGAHRLASRLDSRISRRATSSATLTSLARAIRSHDRPPDNARTPVSSSVAEDSYGWCHTVDSLVRAGRFRKAKELFSSVCERASPAVRTSLGNAILHGYLLRCGSSNRRRLQTVAHNYNMLREAYDFAPDHVTVNILVKALLRSTTEFDAPRIRHLFDAFVRRGYPTVTLHGGAEGEVVSLEPPPFGTKPVAIEKIVSGKLEIPQVEGPPVYKRHVRPLYRMFVTAFHLRGDVVAGRKVVGILKTLDLEGWREFVG